MELQNFSTKIQQQKIPNLSIRQNPDGWINTKPNGRINDQKAELIKNRTAEFDQTAEYWCSIVPTQ